jgi:hypothetical protein
MARSFCNFCEEHHEESTCELKKSAKDKIFGKRPETTIIVLDFIEPDDFMIIKTWYKSYASKGKYDPPCTSSIQISSSLDPGGYWWPPTYSNWLLVSFFFQHVLMYFFVIVGYTLLGLSKAPHILKMDTSGLSPNPTGLFCMFSCQHILLYF